MRNGGGCSIGLLFGRTTSAPFIAALAKHHIGGDVVFLALDMLPRDIAGHGLRAINGLGLAAGTQSLESVTMEAADALQQGGTVLLLHSLSDLILSCGRNEALMVLNRLGAASSSLKSIVCVLHESLHDAKEINFWIDFADCIWSWDAHGGVLKSISTRQQGVKFKQHKRLSGSDDPDAKADAQTLHPVVVPAHKLSTASFQQQVDDFDDNEDNPDDDLDL